MLTQFLSTIIGTIYFFASYNNYTFFLPSIAFVIITLILFTFNGLETKKIVLLVLFSFIFFIYLKITTPSEKIENGIIVTKVIKQLSNSTLLKTKRSYIILRNKVLKNGKYLIKIRNLKKNKTIKSGLPISYEIYSSKEMPLSNQNISLSDSLNNLIGGKAKGISRSFLQAMLLGKTGGVPPNLRKLFADLGISHLIAISGLHLGFAFAIMFFLTIKFFIQINKVLTTNKIVYLAYLSGLSAAIFYYHISGYKISALRALIIIFFIVNGIIIKRKVNGKTFLESAMIIMLIYRPFQLFSLSFQLSFLSYGLIILLLGFIKNLKQGNITKSIVLQILLTILLFPVTSFLFGELSFISPLINIIIIPIVGFIIFPISIVTLILQYYGLNVLIYWSIVINKFISTLDWINKTFNGYIMYNFDYNSIISFLFLLIFLYFYYDLGKIRRITLILLTIIFATYSFYNQINDKGIWFYSDSSIDIFLRTKINNKLRNKIEKKFTPPATITINSKQIIIKRGIFCRSFNLTTNNNTQSGCKFNDIFIRLFKPMAYYFRDISHNDKT